MTSSDGKLLTKEELRLKKVYDGPEGVVHLFLQQGVLWISATYTLDMTKTGNLIKTVEIAEAVFTKLKEEGVKYLYCMAGSKEAFKFNEMLGFKSVNAVIHDKYEIMEKEL